MSIYVVFDGTQKVYRVRKVHLDHNHPHGPDEFSMYASERQPSGPLQQQTITMLENGANPTLLAATLQQQGLQTRPRDLYNLKSKSKFKGTVKNLTFIVKLFYHLHSRRLATCGLLICNRLFVFYCRHPLIHFFPVSTLRRKY